MWQLSKKLFENENQFLIFIVTNKLFLLHVWLKLLFILLFSSSNNLCVGFFEKVKKKELKNVTVEWKVIRERKSILHDDTPKRFDEVKREG